MNRTPLQKLLILKAMTGEEPVTEEVTETGNPATFTTDVRKNLTGLTIPFTPKQSGTGDPAPDNVRPITGITGLTISHSGENTSNPTTYAVTFPAAAGTVFGGELNAVTGVLTVKYAEVSLGSLDYYTAGSTPLYFVNENGITFGSRDLICNQYKTIVSQYWSSMTDYSVMTHPSFGNVFRVRDDRYSDKDVFKAAMAEQGAKLVYELATPVTYNLTAQTIRTLIGENNVWTDTNGTNTVKYLKKVSV